MNPETQNPTGLAAKAGEKVAEIKEKAQDVVNDVTQRAHDLASDANQKAHDLATSANQKAQDAVANVQQKAQDLAANVNQKADGLVNATGEKLSEAGAKLWESAPEGGPIGEALGAAAATLESSGEYLAETNVKAMTEDALGMIRKYPLESVFLGMLAGGLLATFFTRTRGGQRD